MRALIYRKSLLTVVSLTFFLLVGIISFNYFVDPGNRFYHAVSFEKEIASALLANKKVMFHTNYNDRSVEKIYLDQLGQRPEILVIGSSRAMPINQSIFKNPNFHNASVTSASMEDILALYYVYQKKGNPKVLVLSLDPWILDKNHGMKKWKFALFSEFSAAKKMLMGDTDKTELSDKTAIFFEKYSQLLSSEYTHVALLKWLAPATREVIIDPKENECPSCYTRFSDGTRIFSEVQESTRADQADAASIDGILQYPRDFGSFTQLDPSYMNMFEHLIQHLVNQQVKVIFYLPAYEPVAYSAIQADERYKMINSAEEYFAAVANKYHLKLVGGYNPGKLNLQASDFVDDLHLKKQPIEKIFQQQMTV